MIPICYKGHITVYHAAARISFSCRINHPAVVPSSPYRNRVIILLWSCHQQCWTHHPTVILLSHRDHVTDLQWPCHNPAVIPLSSHCDPATILLCSRNHPTEIPSLSHCQHTTVIQPPPTVTHIIPLWSYHPPMVIRPPHFNHIIIPPRSRQHPIVNYSVILLRFCGTAIPS